MHKPSIAFLCLMLIAVAPAAAQQRMYKCVDAKGNVYYTQVPPAQCLGPASVLTPEQQRAQEAAGKKKIEEKEQAKEERRKNLALLNTYPSENDIDDARARALREAQGAIADTEKHILEAQKHKKDLEKEKEFYLKKPLPAKLKRSITDNEIEIKNQTGLLEVKKKEIDKINAKYDEDKRRYRELTKGKAGATAQK